MKKFLSILLILASTQVLSQGRYSGTVRDAVTLKPLPFATVVVSHNKTKGVTTNLHGEFTISTSLSDQSLTFSYMGYESRTVAALTLKPSGNEILLKPSDYSIDEITVYPSENPAHRIINNAIAHVPDNNPIS